MKLGVYILTGLISVFTAGIIAADTNYTDDKSLFLNVVIPERDTLTVDLPRHRIAASTHPEAQAFINDRQVKVYPTGAFVGLVNLERGSNEVVLSAVMDGDTLSKKYTILRPHPLETSPEDPLVIEDEHMEPVYDLWLDDSDVLRVKFKGSPGQDATFDIEGVARRIPMRELPPSETNGVRGIYVGEYTVQPDDFTQDVPIRFRLRRSFWTSVEAESQGRVSIMPEQFPVIAEVTGTRPFLNVGLGTDRLGGARLGFIEPGVLLQITGKVGHLYRVRLSNEMTAWIQSRFIDLLDAHTPVPTALAGSIGTGATLLHDIVTLNLGEKLPYVTRQEINTNRIIIDIYGVTSNTTWITQHLSAEGIRNITWEQVSTELYRLKIELEHDNHWGHRITYTDRGDLRVIIRRPPQIDTDNPLRGRTIAVDAGHGGTNRGALGATGAEEKDIALAISKFVEELLIEHGASVLMTRTDDYNVGMQERVDAVLSTTVDMVVSVHCNSIGYASDPERIRGTSTYYKHIGFKPLADIMYRKMLGLGYHEFGVIGSFNFMLNDMTELPNVLVETAFISNPEEEEQLLDEKMQRKIAQSIVEGIKEYYIKLGFPK